MNRVHESCNKHFTKCLRFVTLSTESMLFLVEKLKDQSNSLNSVRFCNISVRPGDHAPFLETHGISVRLGRSGSMNCDLALTS